MTTASPGNGAALQAMFGRIAGRYRLMNRIMTFGRDRSWRRAVVREAGLAPGGRLLDVASGTGDIALEALQETAEIQAVGADFSVEMMRFGREQAGGGRIGWCAADALALPFPDRSFDAVTSGYLMRNVADHDAAFGEQFRVLRPGGRVVCLDTSPPPPTALRPLILFHLRHVIPLLGRIIAGDGAAYSYLAQSTESFKSPAALAATMETTGFREVSYRTFMFGTMALHSGRRPGGEA